jgi:hypothetical protein
VLIIGAVKRACLWSGGACLFCMISKRIYFL